jgi:Phytanoyl-CoA dioxygenase (PhyH)
MLSPTDLARFAEDGYVCVRSAIPRAVAASCRELAAAQLGVDLAEPSSWQEPVVRDLVLGEPLRQAAEAPRLLGAIHQLLDPDDWQPRTDLGLFVVRFPSEVDPGDTGWHIDSSFEAPDGRWFVNYRSRARGLLLLCLLSDVGVDDAPARILPGSHMQMPPLLHSYGDDGMFGLEAPLPEPTDRIALATGEAGDVYLCHPFLVHAATWPHRGNAPRFMAQPPISLNGSLQLDGDINRISPVARTVRRALSAERGDRFAK